MKFRIKETRHTRNVSVDIDINKPDEEFVGLVDENNSPGKLKPLIDTAWKGLKNGFAPQLCEEGVGGTYFMHDAQKRKIGVFKPQDEEPYNINNPKGYRPRLGSDAGIKEGILVGEASIRECAAYLLDHGNFASVPATDLVLCQHPAFHFSDKEEGECVDAADMMDDYEVLRSPKLGARAKIGSFQEFVSHDGDCEDLSRSTLRQFPVDEVHKIAQLDIRIMNSDRHGGNILYKEVFNDFTGEESFELIPIDHGYALPSKFDEASFEWLQWPQAKEPMSERTRKYIASINVKQEVEMLRVKFGKTIREEHINVLKTSTMLLQKGAKAGLTFYEIGSMVCRPYLDEMSTLERLVAKAIDEVPQKDENGFLEVLSKLMDEEIQIIAQEGI